MANTDEPMDKFLGKPKRPRVSGSWAPRVEDNEGQHPPQPTMVDLIGTPDREYVQRPEDRESEEEKKRKESADIQLSKSSILYHLDNQPNPNPNPDAKIISLDEHNKEDISKPATPRSQGSAVNMRGFLQSITKEKSKNDEDDLGGDESSSIDDTQKLVDEHLGLDKEEE